MFKQKMTEPVFYYKNKLPVKGELVMSLIIEIDYMGVTCELLEYGNLKCLMPLSEVSRQRFQAISRLIKIGHKQLLQVINVDVLKGYVDVSKQDINEDDKDVGGMKYKKAKKVHELVKRVALITGVTVDELYENFVWDLYEKYDHPLDAFRSYATGEYPNITNEKLCNSKVPQELVKLCSHHFAIEQVKIVSEIEIKSFEGGIEAIRRALNVGIKLKGISINIIASPSYLISTVTHDERAGIELVEYATTLIKEELLRIDKELGISSSEFKIAKPPHVLESIR